MSEFFQALEQRRSIRKYEEREVSGALVNRVLEAVRWSPSWANTQCWEVVAVREPAIKARLQETIAPKNPATRAIVAAPVVLALCGRLGTSGYYDKQATTKFGDWYLFDLGIATQSLCLAAHDLGLGTVIVGLFDHDRAKTVLNVPQGVELVALIPLGYPAKSPSAPKRREVAEFAHAETY
ncbi:MAG: nitroreductase family protein [Desulfobacteraceae bacterium]|jgi:nitroreductase|nr:nitroreductase family protein [Desulfobacteraceae bacterium]